MSPGPSATGSAANREAADTSRYPIITYLSHHSSGVRGANITMFSNLVDTMCIVRVRETLDRQYLTLKMSFEKKVKILFLL